ncbi:hypothetical protein AWW67_16270 [Roseivirga seohaensis]|uniref:Uncharacterized protein n=1 Tax=Roseivirga seohaensis TaxID=1914963 RepID=A0A150Y356_9BACT|nr:hypothetical protein AWW67_16270 [Roseivirga seohaensis]
MILKTTKHGKYFKEIYAKEVDGVSFEVNCPLCGKLQYVTFKEFEYSKCKGRLSHGSKSSCMIMFEKF